MQSPALPELVLTPTVCFEDDHLLVVEKPAGLLAVPGRGPDKQDCLLSRLQAVRPETLLVHRLDQATSGLMLFARNLQMQRRLSGLFQSRQIHKCYVAVVHGLLQPTHGIVNLPLITDWPQRPRQKIDMVMGKPSETHWQCLQHDVAAHRSRVELHPITGRSHQLRVHMLSLGHPIVGDTLYGPADDAPRMHLHACRLDFVHPERGIGMRFESPPDF